MMTMPHIENPEGTYSMLRTFGLTLGGKTLTPAEFYPHLPFFIITYWDGIYNSVEVEITIPRVDIRLSQSLISDGSFLSANSSGETITEKLWDTLTTFRENAFLTSTYNGFLPEGPDDVEYFLSILDSNSVYGTLYCEDVALTHLKHVCELLVLLLCLYYGLIKDSYSVRNRILILRKSIQIDYLPITGNYNDRSQNRLIHKNFIFGVYTLLEEFFTPFPCCLSEDQILIITTWWFNTVVYSDWIPSRKG